MQKRADSASRDPLALRRVADVQSDSRTLAVPGAVVKWRRGLVMVQNHRRRIQPIVGPGHFAGLVLVRCLLMPLSHTMPDRRTLIRFAGVLAILMACVPADRALGVASNVLLPTRKASVGAKYFKEFSNSSTFEGYSLQISAAITFWKLDSGTGPAASGPAVIDRPADMR